MRKTATTLWDPADHLVSEEDVVSYLAAALADGDPSLVCAALADCMRAMGLRSADRGDADSRALDALVKKAVITAPIMPNGSIIGSAKTKSILDLAGTLKRPKGKKVSVQDMNAWR